MSDQLETKTLKGSGGYVIANLTPEEIKKGKLAGADIFLGAVGRIEETRIIHYYCKNCDHKFDGTPEIKYEKLNQEVAKGYTLSEQGEYICKQCGSLIAQYKKFAEHSETVPQSSGNRGKDEVQDGFVALRKLVGMNVYDTEAILLGTVKDIGLRDKSRIVLIISTTEQTEKEIVWDSISKIGDVVLISKNPLGLRPRKCKCGFDNRDESKFCEQCGSKLS